MVEYKKISDNYYQKVYKGGKKVRVSKDEYTSKTTSKNPSKTTTKTTKVGGKPTTKVGGERGPWGDRNDMYDISFTDRWSYTYPNWYIKLVDEIMDSYEVNWQALHDINYALTKFLGDRADGLTPLQKSKLVNDEFEKQWEEEWENNYCKFINNRDKTKTWPWSPPKKAPDFIDENKQIIIEEIIERRDQWSPMCFYYAENGVEILKEANPAYKVCIRKI